MKESNEALARKYRPNSFEELIGQESISQTLSLALDSNRLSHAYLFSGLRGSGKTSTARIFAKALNCQKGISHKPCGECDNCLGAKNHIDIIEMDAASNRGIDDIRELIEQTKYKPASSRFKIFIIDEVHMLTPQAFNALLKTLEEPPEYVKFILATTDPLKLPATILSRTQHFRFKSIAQSKIVEHLIHILNLESIGFEKEALVVLARSGGGSLRDTLTMLDQAIVYSKGFVDLATVTDMLGLVDPAYIGNIFDDIFAKDIESLKQKLMFLADYEASMIVDEMIIYLKEKMLENDNQFSSLMIDRFFRALSEAKTLLHINSDSDFVLMLMFLKMIESLKIKEIDELIEGFSKQITQDRVVQKQIVTPKIQVIEVDNFTKLQNSISDRSFELGECFSKSIKFISFEDNILTWESCASEKCRGMLTHGYGIIKQLAREIYGVLTNIKHIPCTKTMADEAVVVKEQLSIQEEAEFLQEEAISMIEEAEFGNDSCVENCASGVASSENILQEPFVKKALEIFEPNRVKVLSKV